MRQPELVRTASALSVVKEPTSVFITDSYRLALDQLSDVFTKAQPLAIMIGEGKDAASLVIDSFLAGIEDDVTVARITEPPSDAIAVMRMIIRAIGLGSKGLSTADLEKVFAMFLAYQRTHDRRTIICIEQAQECGRWVLDKVRRLVQLEAKKEYGLTVILSGESSLDELLSEPPLDEISAHAGIPVSLPPFTLAETTEYIRRRVESAGSTDIDQVFEYRAISLVHELSAGVPDAVNALCSSCLQLADEEDAATVTTDLVKAADMRLQPEPMPQQLDAEVESVEAEAGVEVELKLDPEDNDSAAPRIMLTHNGITLREMTMDQSRLVIGRAEDNDLRIDSDTTSRHHALIVRQGDATFVMDLNSTNGTYVNSCRVSSQVLIDQDIISIGDHGIKFIDPNARVRTPLEGTGFNETGIKKSLEDIRKVRARENMKAVPVPGNSGNHR